MADCAGTSRVTRTIAVAALLATAIAVLGGCATYSAKFADLRPDLAHSRYDAALQTVEKNKGDKDLLLYHLERGMVLHYADRWAESNESFAAAERLADELYTKSISEGVLSLFTNDNSISYRARPFEMAMVPYFRALNYVYLGKREDALVEGRKASQMLARYVDHTLNGLDDDEKGELAQIRNNAFLLYFSGMLYDWDGEINDAFIAYRNAAEAYAANSELLGVGPARWLGGDLARTAGRLGFVDELEYVQRTYPELFADPETTDRPSGVGEVVFLLEVGYVPQKIQNKLSVPILESDGDGHDRLVFATTLSGRLGDAYVLNSGDKIAYWLSFAMPELWLDPSAIDGARLSAGVAGSHARTACVENLAAAAAITFEAEQGKILLKTIVRGLAKYGVTKQAEDQGWLVGALANLFGVATETADTRSWLTLPENIHLARLSLPPGIYDLQVELVDAAGRVLATETVADVTVRLGDWTFVSRRVF